jgi:LasA protease
MRMGIQKAFVLSLLLSCLLTTCVRPANPLVEPWSVSSPTSVQTEAVPETPAALHPIARQPGTPVSTPTPDPQRILPTPRTTAEEYVVQAGDTLGLVSQRYGISLEALIQANELQNPDLLNVGQLLVIPAPLPEGPGPAFKIIPDSELVYGPMSANFDLAGFIASQGGYLASYSEEVDAKQLSGTDILRRVAQEYSVNPRLLLAVLEYQCGWVTRSNPQAKTPAPCSAEYPLGKAESWRKGLYQQLSWAANSLNRGYYLWRVNGVGSWLLTSGVVVPVDPTINAGTAGVQAYFAGLYDRSAWNAAVSEGGLFDTYYALFGYPFDYAVEPLLPVALTQPLMQLPFEPGLDWAFTGGPHGGWGSGSAWAALDFAPPGEALGCVQSDAWVTAVADGLIVRTGNGAVIQDLDGDGLEQTGWTVLYQHIETRERVASGVYLHAGERIGHPSCEGGVSSGTHVHLARRYNGEWIPADQNIPFVLDGWVSSGTGVEYDGYLTREDQTIEAWEGYFPENKIHR